MTFVAAAAMALTACSVESSSDEPLDPETATVAEFNDSSIPVQDDTAEAFFKAHPKECPNVDLSQHVSSDFLDEIQTHALGADDADKISSVFYEFCSNAPDGA